MPSSNENNRLMPRLLTAGIATAIGVAVIVAVLFVRRATSPIYLQEPGGEEAGHRFIYDARLGWRNIPGWESTTFGKPLTINEHGLRGPAYGFLKPVGVRRVLVLGDSYVWGYGVADERVLTRALERRLNAAATWAAGGAGGGEGGEGVGGRRGGTAVERWQVLNAGVSGWGNDQALLYLRGEGVKYQPDVVVAMVFQINDPANNASSPQYGLNKPVFLNTDLELANVPVPKPGEEAAPVTTRAHPLRLTAAILAEMHAVCERAGAELVVAKFGRFLHPEREVGKAGEEMLKEFVLELADVPYLNLDAAYAERGLDRAALTEGNRDGHWNAFGHEQTAAIVHEFLAARGLAPPPAPAD